MKRYRILLTATLILFAALSPGFASDGEGEDKALAAYKEGRRLFFLGQYDKAVPHFRAAVGIDAETSIYRLFLARALNRSGNSIEAEKVILEILQKNPEHIEAGLAIANIYDEAKEWKKLVDVLKPILAYKHDYIIYHLLAKAYYNLENLKEARAHYEKALEQNPDSANDLYELGNIYLGESRFALAADVYEKCLALNADSKVLHYKLASAYSNLRNYLGAITEREIKGGKQGAIKDDFYILDPVPGKKDAFYVAPPKSAIFRVCRAIEMGVDTPDIFFLRANIWLGAGRFDKAYECYAAVEEKIAKEEKALFYHQYAQAAFGLEKYEEFLQFTNKAIELKPDAYKPALLGAYMRVASRKNRDGDIDAYIHYLIKAIGEKPDVASHHLMLANAYRDKKEYKKAMMHWRLVLEIEPDRPDRIALLNQIKKYSDED